MRPSLTKEVQFRFYEELNDFLPSEKRKTAFAYRFSGSPSVKDAIEAVGVPHTEVDMILVNGMSVGFDYRLQQGDTISVYPVFESLDISSVTHLRAKPLRQTKFILDGHLGKLARLLRMLGFDTLYDKNYEDAQIVCCALLEGRIILTRDRGVLKRKEVTHGYWVRSTNTKEQIKEVLPRFDLMQQLQPFCRCMVCNGVIKEIEKAKILHRLPPKIKVYYNEFYLCTGCEKIYWEGSHFKGMQAYIKDLMDEK